MTVRIKIFALIALVLFSMILSLSLGPAELSMREIWAGLTSHDSQNHHRIIIQELRLPRTLLALIIGAGLGASGAALQGFTRNDLAAPGILGFSACAALGAVTCLYFGASPALVAGGALLGTLIGIGAMLGIGGVKKGASTLILAGIGIGALATALTGLIMNLSPNPWALSEIVYWMMGTLKDASLTDVINCGVLTLVGIILLWWIARDLKTLSLGEVSAQSLGVSIPKVQIFIVLGVALCVGSSVAVAGTIGFVGLFVPHIVRRVINSDPEKLILRSALAGAVFLLWADMATRLLSGPGTTLYIGMLTSLIGVPFFLYLVIKEVRS